MGKLLVVEPDADFGEVVAYVLAREGHRVDQVRDLPSAEELRAAQPFDLVLLAPCHLEGRVLEVCARLQREHGLPTIILAERDSAYDAVRCLDAGAEDYLHKPCDFSELTARVRAALRRRARRSSEGVVVGPLQIDLVRREVRYGDRMVRLGPTEFRLLEELVMHAGRVVPAGELLRRVWQSDGNDTELLRVTVYRLRRKLGWDGRSGGLIRSVPGVGFMFDPHTATAAGYGGHAAT